VKIHYLDNSATTRVLPQAAEKAAFLMTEEFGNPSSLHTLGFRAKQELEKARGSVAAKLGAKPEEIYFTSGGTEANNLAVLGGALARQRRGKKIVTTAVEHDSILNAMKELETMGFQVEYIKPAQSGDLSEEALMQAIDEDTILVSVMQVNNETGAIFPVQAAAKAIRRKKAPALLHVDAVQAFGKMDLAPGKWGVDLMTVSAHKIHGPKGTGALYVGKGVKLHPRVFGGGQEKGLRPGTESLPLIGAFGEAVAQLPKTGEAREQVQQLCDSLVQGLREIPEVTLHLPQKHLPYVVNFSAGAVRAETMLHFLAQREVYVSSGSACGKAKPSHVLEAMGIEKQQIESALRVSFSRFNTQEDVQALLDGVREGLSLLAHR
jgi:cysteine desulfurase